MEKEDIVVEKARELTMFEKVLLIAGLLILVIGYYFISKVFMLEGAVLSWEFLQTVFLWLLIVVFLIFLAFGEDIREGIMLYQCSSIEEIRISLKKQHEELMKLTRKK